MKLKEYMQNGLSILWNHVP